MSIGLFWGSSFCTLSVSHISYICMLHSACNFCSKDNPKCTRIPIPRTPRAPRHGPRPPSCLKGSEMRQVAAILFPESAFPSHCMVPSVLPEPLCKSLASNRVLFYEDELCQAVAQKKLLWCELFLPHRVMFLCCVWNR